MTHRAPHVNYTINYYSCHNPLLKFSNGLCIYILQGLMLQLFNKRGNKVNTSKQSIQ